MNKILGVNVDHVATLREARQIREPDPVQAASLAELGGADQITIHLREDRRHIQERDCRLLRQTVSTRLNLEMAATPEMVQFAISLLPDMVTLVPESRHEVTTEGGLDVAGHIDLITKVVEQLKKHDIVVSLFIDPDIRQVKATKKTGADAIEFHTGRYATMSDQDDAIETAKELAIIKDQVVLAQKNNLIVNAGHGLNYRNVGPIAAIPGIVELNIGHAIVGRAVMVGMQEAVREMKRLIREAELFQKTQGR
jgi:pyridoxine 5-phosphate synthase